MEILKFENYCFAYPNEKKYALYNINLTVNEGEFITLCGKSGCGKSTLQRCIKPMTAPYGFTSGNIYWNGVDISQLSEIEQSKKIGFVMQNPDNQIVTDKVWHELAFGLESLGYDNGEIRRSVAEISAFFGIEQLFHKSTSELSGGQKQIVNLASVMIMKPELLILDEPTSQLDPIFAEEFLELLSKINDELGTIIILCEHRLENAVEISDRVILMENGQIIDNITSDTLACYLKTADEDNCKYSVDNFEKKEPTVVINNVSYSYNDEYVVKNLTAEFYSGEVYAVVGGNGAGKTTALSLIGGMLNPAEGSITTVGKVGMLVQNPQTMFAASTVLRDLEQMFCESKITKSEKMRRIDEVARLCGISGLIDKHPYDLSGGEQQRAALAKLLLIKPQILLLDEPTKGLDKYLKNKLSNILNELKKTGMTIIMVTHDMEFCQSCADKCAVLFDGNLVGEENTKEFLQKGIVYAPKRQIYDIFSDDKPENKAIEFLPNEQANNRIKTKQAKNKCIAGILITALIMLLTVLAGIYILGDRKYYFISLLVMLEAFAGFALRFEKRRPKARELIIISVLCGLAVTGRVAFYMLPHFKAMFALVIISGIAFGGETGCLVGVITAFVSNFFFGQGPWTPWQMLALGSIGLTAGLVYTKADYAKNKLLLSLFGGVSVVVIYGGIMNPASVIMYQSAPTAEMIISAYILGFPLDMVSGVATAIFLWLISEPFLEKLERIKVKYGL